MTTENERSDKSVGDVVSDAKIVIDRLQSYIRQLAPHAKKREGGQLIVSACEALTALLETIGELAKDSDHVTPQCAVCGVEHRRQDECYPPDDERAKECSQDDRWSKITQESPPWDGTPVLVWCLRAGIWISSRQRGKSLGGMPTTGHNWYLERSGVYPTHWKHLPEPPDAA